MAERQTKTAACTTGDRLDEDPSPRRATGDGPAERRCMSCQEIFVSEGWHNRLCRRCARRGQSRGTYAARGLSRTPLGGID